MIPTADQAAHIIIAAFRECKADPLTVANPLRGNGRHGNGPNARSMAGRRYAALAMRDLFPAAHSGVIGRMVGSSAPHDFIAQLVRDRAKGRLAWLDPAALERIKAEVVQYVRLEPEAKQQVKESPENGSKLIHPVQTSTPFFTRPRAKVSLEDELRRAVENTARLTVR